MATHNYHEDGFYWSRKAFDLHSEEQHTNARYITKYLREWGLKDNVIAAMLGNFQSESSMNPGAYFRWVDFSAVSFGLAQWDPTSKYQNWHDDNYPGIMYEHLECQLNRIKYEYENNIQFLPKDEWDDMTFKEFVASDLPCQTLAKIWCRCYEIPAAVIYNPDEETEEEHKAKKERCYKERAEQSEYWYEFITGIPAPDQPDNPGGGGSVTRKGLSKLLLYAVGSDIV